MSPNDLDKVHETDHFEIHYTLTGNDAVINNEYIYTMGEIYEDVWSFFIDTLDYDPPIDSNSDTDNLYKIYVENHSMACRTSIAGFKILQEKKRRSHH